MAHHVAVDAAKLHDQLLAEMPGRARHDADTCPFCLDKAQHDSAQDIDTTSRNPPADSGPDASASQVPTNQEGGTSKSMADTEQISKETHEALQSKAVSDAVATTEKALHTITAERDDLKKQVETLSSEKAALAADNERINKGLDSAQVELKTAKDEVATLKADIAKKDDDAAKAELASKRVEQVKNLKLFDDKYVSEKASSWAGLDETAWSERIEEWRQLKPATAADSDSDTGKKPTADTASVMSGTTESLTKTPDGDKKTNPRRAALGLVG